MRRFVLECSTYESSVVNGALIVDLRLRQLDVNVNDLT